RCAAGPDHAVDGAGHRRSVEHADRWSGRADPRTPRRVHSAVLLRRAAGRVGADRHPRFSASGGPARRPTVRGGNGAPRRRPARARSVQFFAPDGALRSPLVPLKFPVCTDTSPALPRWSGGLGLAPGLYNARDMISDFVSQAVASQAAETPDALAVADGTLAL